MKKLNKSVITGDDLVQAFGDGFFDLPHDERADMLTRKMLGQHVKRVTKEDARRHNESKTVHNGTES
jgi:hypothetical protein